MSIDLADKPYSPGQISISTWDKDSNRIRVDAEVTAVIGELAVELDANSDSVSIGNPFNDDTLNINTDGSLNANITNEGIVSTGNTTFAPLNSNSTFTGSFVDALLNPNIDSIMLSNVSGTLYVDTSNDGSTIFTTTTFPSIFNSSINLYCVSLNATFNGRFIRIRYINGPASQSTFKLQTILRPYLPGQFISSIERSITPDSVAALNRSILMAKKNDGTYTNVAVTDTGLLKVLPEESEVEYDYASASVAISATSTILSKTFLTNKKIKTVCLSGDNLGKYKVFLNGNIIFTLRTTWTNYNVELSLNSLNVLSGDILTITVINNNTSIADFNATIIYQTTS